MEENPYSYRKINMSLVKKNKGIFGHPKKPVRIIQD